MPTAELGRFLAVGAFNTLATYLIYAGLSEFLPYKIAFTISFVLGIVISWQLNARYTFNTSVTGNNLIRYAAIYISTWLVSIFVLGALVETVGIHHLLAPLIIVAVITPANFVLAKFIFSKTGITRLN
jgi:putative flippase GtrA